MKNYRKCYETMKKQTGIISSVCFGKGKRGCDKCPYLTKDIYNEAEAEIALRKQRIKHPDSTKLNNCTRCGGHAKVRHIIIGDFGLLLKFRFHPHQYYCICDNCGAKTRSYHKEKLAIKDWNERCKNNAN